MHERIDPLPFDTNLLRKFTQGERIKMSFRAWLTPSWRCLQCVSCIALYQPGVIKGVSWFDIQQPIFPLTLTGIFHSLFQANEKRPFIRSPRVILLPSKIVSRGNQMKWQCKFACNYGN